MSNILSVDLSTAQAGGFSHRDMAWFAGSSHSTRAFSTSSPNKSTDSAGVSDQADPADLIHIGQLRLTGQILRLFSPVALAVM